MIEKIDLKKRVSECGPDGSAHIVLDIKIKDIAEKLNEVIDAVNVLGIAMEITAGNIELTVDSMNKTMQD